MSKVDWDKAPEGATHYNGTGECTYPWLKVEQGEYFFYKSCEEVWVKYISRGGVGHVARAVARPGFPAPGTRCEVQYEGKTWVECFIVGMDSSGKACVFEMPGGGFDAFSFPEAFRQICQKRNEKIEALEAAGLSRQAATIAYDTLFPAD